MHYKHGKYVSIAHNNVHKNTSLSSTDQDMNKFTSVGQNTNSVAETFVAATCDQLSNIPYVLRNCDLLAMNKSREQKLQVKKKKSFTDCHTDGSIMKAK